MSKTTIILYRRPVSSFEIERKSETLFNSIVYPVNNGKSDDLQSMAKYLLLNNGKQIIFRLTHGMALESNDQDVRQVSEKRLLEEIAFAKLICKQRIVYLYQLTTEKSSNLSRILYLQSKGDLFVIETKMTDWHWWNQARAQTDYSSSVQVAVELTSKTLCQAEILRWIGEPIYCLIIPVELFSFNVEAGYHELSDYHQQLLHRFAKKGVTTVMLKTNEKCDDSLKGYVDSLLFYLEETLYMKKKCHFYHDSLMIPLQPLYENLDNRTYELFERDPAKYDIYQKAVEEALLDLIPKSQVAVLMIVGAGRGPLVRAIINAGVNTERKVKIFIVEKNPSAIVTLNALKKEIWTNSDITIFAEDMRFFQPPEKADILVSELLGSFGCNELSPECLDGAQKHLKPNGISIPTSYTSYVNPIMSSKIYEKNLNLDRLYHHRDKSLNIQTDFECNYIVCPNSVFHISEPQALFTFTHPNDDAHINNSRYKALKFPVSVDTVLHGFLGYFEATLYKGHTISILPKTHTDGMISWHCYYFPITVPQQIKNGDTIEVSFWRCVENNKVWYEWCANNSHIHNMMGKSFPIFK